MQQKTDSIEIEIFTLSNVNSREILISEGWKEFLIERCYQMLDFIIHQIIINRVTNAKYQKDDFISLNNNYHFKRFLTSRYCHIIKHILIKHGIIEIYNPANPNHQGYNRKVKYQVASFENGIVGQSKGYRITKEYNSRHHQILVDKYTPLHNNIVKNRKKDLQQLDDVTKWSDINIKKLGIRKEAAVLYVDEWYNNLQKNPYKVKLKKKQAKVLKKLKGENEKLLYLYGIIDDKYNKYHYSIQAFAENQTFLTTRDKTGKRIHSAITVLWSKLRQFLFIKESPNKQIYSIDVASCQPYCLIKIILEYFPDGILPADVENYINLVCTGKFYSYLSDLLNIPADGISGFKTRLFNNVFYCQNHHNFDSPEARLFRTEFSTVYQIIQKTKYKNYKDLPITMQRIESSVIVDDVLVHLMNKYPNKFFTTIHDSILFTDGANRSEIESLITFYFTSKVGYAPSLKEVEKFNAIL